MQQALQEGAPQEGTQESAGEPASGARDAEWGPVLVLKNGAASAGAAGLLDWELLSQPSLTSHSGIAPLCAPPHAGVCPQPALLRRGKCIACTKCPAIWSC